MSKTYTAEKTSVSCVGPAGVKSYNYVQLESTLGQTGDTITGSYWFHWHEPYGWNLQGVSYLWYIRFIDANGNKIKDVNVTLTNVNHKGERIFYYPASTYQPQPVNSSNCRTETVLDRYANDSTPNKYDVFYNTGTSGNYSYWKNATRCKNATTHQAASVCVRKDGTYQDATRISFSIPLSEVPSNAKAYCNYIIFAQVHGNNEDPSGMQDPTDPSNQFMTYTLPSEQQALIDDDTRIDFFSKVYFKNGTWSDRGRVYHKESGEWVKKYAYRKLSGSWRKLP